jgi:hypothetical protein
VYCLSVVVGGQGVTTVCCRGPMVVLSCNRWSPQVFCVEKGFPLWCWYVGRASGFDGVVRLSLIEKKLS